MRTIIRGFGAAATLIMLMAQASAQIETVVVTGSRNADYDSPHVYMLKRADFVITTVKVFCDTRDAVRRKEEIEDTLRGMMHVASQTKTISLGLGEGVIGDLKEANFPDIIQKGGQVDSSAAEIVIMSAVSNSDNFDAVTNRIKAYVDSVQKVGRTLITFEGDWNLTIVGPEQYRDKLIDEIASDSKHLATQFGQGNTVAVDGLEHRVSWFRKGPLDLGLYIPYRVHIAPAH